jgi:hypothetical protein
VFNKKRAIRKKGWIEFEPQGLKLNFENPLVEGIACYLNMSKLIVKINDFSVSNLSIGQVKALESGGKMASLFYKYGDNSSSTLTTQIGSLSLPYGMNTFDKAGPVKYSMDLSLRGHDENANVKAIYDAFMALDNWMIDQGVKNSKAWFKADLSRDVVKAFYTPMVKVAKDADGNPKPYPPTIKINLKKQNDQFDVKVYDDQKRPYEGVPLEDLLVKGAMLTTLIQCTSVWFAGSKFGLSWKAKQIRMDRVPESIRGYSFLDDDDTTTSRPAPRATATSSNKFSALDTEADEEDVEAEEEEVEVPAPKSSVVSAMLPKASAPAPAPAPATLDEEAEDHEPIPVPAKKATVTAKKVAVKAAGKK